MVTGVTRPAALALRAFPVRRIVQIAIPITNVKIAYQDFIEELIRKLALLHVPMGNLPMRPPRPANFAMPTVIHVQVQDLLSAQNAKKARIISIGSVLNKIARTNILLI